MPSACITVYQSAQTKHISEEVTMDNFKTVSQLAEILGTTTHTIYQKAGSGEIASHKICGRVRFSDEDIQAYIESTRREAV